MNRQRRLGIFLENAAELLFKCALIGIGVLGVRAGYMAVQRIRPVSSATVLVKPSAEPSAQPWGPLTGLGLPPPGSSRVVPLPSELMIVASAAPPKPKATRVYVVVKLEPPRSEVLINGVSVGQTPYLGEAGCELGSTVRITVIPPKGMPVHHTSPCQGEIRLGH